MIEFREKFYARRDENVEWKEEITSVDIQRSKSFERDYNDISMRLSIPTIKKLIKDINDGFFYVDDMKIDIPLMYHEKLSSYEEKEIIMGIRPEDLHGEGIVADTYPSANFDFEIEVAELLGHEYILHGSLNGQKMCAKVNSRLEPEAHTTIKLTMDLSKVHFFDLETENRID